MKLDAHFKQAQLLTFKKGQIILRPDDIPKDIFYIESGHVRVYQLTEWGDEKLFVIFKEQELFPLLLNIPLQSFYEALDNVKVRKIPGDDFEKLLKKNPKISLELTQRIAGLFELLLNRIDSLEYTNAYARLISRLLYLAQRFGEKRGSKILITVPISHKDIASSIGLTRETISREFEKLEKKGIVKYVNYLILINNMDKLRKQMSAHYDQRLI